MIQQKRPPAPKWLKERYKTWGKKDKDKNETGKELFWYTHDKERVNIKLRPLLIQMTNNHCSFCDHYPMGAAATRTIEHFRPKSKHPLLSHTWHNLFLCCNACQEKGDDFDRKLLKPDQVSYSFEKYFWLDTHDWKLKPNPTANNLDKERAAITIQLYKLNINERRNAREVEFRKFKDKNNINDYSYRYMFL